MEIRGVYRHTAELIKNDVDAIEKLFKEIHELKRTQSEKEAVAELRGRNDGMQEIKRQIRAMIS